MKEKIEEFYINMFFDESFINEVKEKNDIVDVISAYTNLKRNGGNYVGLCPFHSEKTPSFSVSADKQLYYCFGCGAGGTVLNFIEGAEGLDFQETVRFLAQRAGINVPEAGETESEESKLKKKIYEMNKIAGRLYFDVLNSNEGMVALSYLRNRGLTNKTITKFGLGYSPNKWDFMYKTLKSKGYRDDEIVKSGLCVNKNGRIFDFFRNRVMFPVMDLRGNVIAFGGRDLGDGQPKYLNTGETPVFKKRQNLFNLNLAKTKKEDYIILAEGYMDVISLYQAGFTNAVASLGTAFAPEHSLLIKKYTEKVIISYDSDMAGRNATMKALSILKKDGIRVKILRMTGAKDPDELIKKFGREAYQYAIDSALSGIEFDLESIYPKGGFIDEEEKIEYIKKASDILKYTTDKLEIEVYAKKVASQTGVSVETVKAYINDKQKKEKYYKIKNFEKNVVIQKKSVEETLIKIIIENPLFFKEIKDKISVEDFSDELAKKLFSNFLSLWEKGIKPDVSMVFDNLTAQEAKRAGKLFIEKEPVGNFLEFFTSLIERIREEREKFNPNGDLEDLLNYTKRLKEKENNKKQIKGEV